MHLLLEYTSVGGGSTLAPKSLPPRRVLAHDEHL